MDREYTKTGHKCWRVPKTFTTRNCLIICENNNETFLYLYKLYGFPLESSTTRTFDKSVGRDRFCRCQSIVAAIFVLITRTQVQCDLLKR